MKILSAIGMFALVFALMSGAAFAIGYCVDIAPTDPPDKTFDDEWTGIVGEEIEIDVYLNDVPESIFTAGIFMLPYQYPGEEVTDIQIYDGFYGPPGPWDPGFSIPCWILCAGLPPFPVSFIVGNFEGAQPDGDGDIIICTIRLRFLQEGWSTTPGPHPSCFATGFSSLQPLENAVELKSFLTTHDLSDILLLCSAARSTGRRWPCRRMPGRG